MNHKFILRLIGIPSYRFDNQQFTVYKVYLRSQLAFQRLKRIRFLCYYVYVWKQDWTVSAAARERRPRALWARVETGPEEIHFFRQNLHSSAGKSVSGASVPVYLQLQSHMKKIYSLSQLWKIAADLIRGFFVVVCMAGNCHLEFASENESCQSSVSISTWGLCSPMHIHFHILDWWSRDPNWRNSVRNVMCSPSIISSTRWKSVDFFLLLLLRK